MYKKQWPIYLTTSLWFSIVNIAYVPIYENGPLLAMYT